MKKNIIADSAKELKDKIQTTNPNLLELINKKYSFTLSTDKGDKYETSDSSSTPKDKERISRFLNSYSC